MPAICLGSGNTSNANGQNLNERNNQHAGQSADRKPQCKFSHHLAPGRRKSTRAARVWSAANASGAVVSPPPFNLNTISRGVSTADFYLAVPTAIVRFLESDTHTKLVAKPQLRGAEGNKMTLNLGSEIPVISTVFGAAAAGGFATIPQSSFNYRKVGVNLDITPRVTYEGEVILELTVENSALGANGKPTCWPG